MVNSLNEKQLLAFMTVKKAFDTTTRGTTLRSTATSSTTTTITTTGSANGSNDKHGSQLLMFLSGQGGTGKSHLIRAVSLLAYITYGRTEGLWGPIRLCAPTGNSAYNIGGSTWQSALGKSVTEKALKNNTPMAAAGVQRLVHKALGCKCFVLDEISLLSSQETFEVHKRLCYATGVHDKPFGGLHVIFSGDFYQLKCFKGAPIPSTLSHPTNVNNAESRMGREIWEQFNSFIELTENCRARETNGVLSQLAAFNSAARLCDFSDPRTLLTINSRVRNNLDSIIKVADTKAIYMTDTHNKIGDINDVYQQRAESRNTPIHRLVADHVPSKLTMLYPDQHTRNILYGTKGDIKGAATTLMLSHIDLYVGCRVRCTRNLSTELGIYNGRMGTVMGFVYQQPTITDADRKQLNRMKFSIMTAVQREIPIVLVQLDAPSSGGSGDDKKEKKKKEKNNGISISAKTPWLIPFSPIDSMEQLIIGTNKYIRRQIPLLPAAARSIHSVQGLTAHNGAIIDPKNGFYAGTYVAISRATSLDNVYLTQPATANDFSHDSEFRQTVGLEYKRLRKLFPQTTIVAATSADTTTSSSSSSTSSSS